MPPFRLDRRPSEAISRRFLGELRRTICSWGLFFVGVFIGDRLWFFALLLLLLFFGGDQVTEMLLLPLCRIMYSSGEGAGDAKLRERLLSVG